MTITYLELSLLTVYVYRHLKGELFLKNIFKDSKQYVKILIKL